MVMIPVQKKGAAIARLQRQWSMLFPEKPSRRGRLEEAAITTTAQDFQALINAANLPLSPKKDRLRQWQMGWALLQAKAQGRWDEQWQSLANRINQVSSQSGHAPLDKSLFQIGETLSNFPDDEKQNKAIYRHWWQAQVTQTLKRLESTLGQGSLSRYGKTPVMSLFRQDKQGWRIGRYPLLDEQARLVRYQQTIQRPIIGYWYRLKGWWQGISQTQQALEYLNTRALLEGLQHYDLQASRQQQLQKALIAGPRYWRPLNSFYRELKTMLPFAAYEDWALAQSALTHKEPLDPRLTDDTAHSEPLGGLFLRLKQQVDALPGEVFLQRPEVLVFEARLNKALKQWRWPWSQSAKQLARLHQAWQALIRDFRPETLEEAMGVYWRSWGRPGQKPLRVAELQRQAALLLEREASEYHKGQWTRFITAVQVIETAFDKVRFFDVVDKLVEDISLAPSGLALTRMMGRWQKLFAEIEKMLLEQINRGFNTDRGSVRTPFDEAFVRCRQQVFDAYHQRKKILGTLSEQNAERALIISTESPLAQWLDRESPRRLEASGLLSEEGKKLWEEAKVSCLSMPYYQQSLVFYEAAETYLSVVKQKKAATVEAWQQAVEEDPRVQSLIEDLATVKKKLLMTLHTDKRDSSETGIEKKEKNTAYGIVQDGVEWWQSFRTGLWAPPSPHNDRPDAQGNDGRHIPGHDKPAMERLTNDLDAIMFWLQSKTAEMDSMSGFALLHDAEAFFFVARECRQDRVKSNQIAKEERRLRKELQRQREEETRKCEVLERRLAEMERQLAEKNRKAENHENHPAGEIEPEGLCCTTTGEVFIRQI